MSNKLIFAVVGMLASVAGVARADSAEDPNYTSWAKCSPGTSVVILEVHTGDSAPPIKMTMTLKDVAKDHCTISTAIEMDHKTMPGSDQTIDKEVTDPAQIRKIRQGEASATADKITTPAGSFDCKKIKDATQTGSDITLWMDSDVPGGLVKMVMKESTTDTTTMELQSVSKK